MRFILAVLTFAILAAEPARADQNDPRLDHLFAQLAAVRTAPEAAAIEAKIMEVWTLSGSDTIDVLMARAQSAAEAQDYATAKKLLDSVAEMKPAYAQVWFRRAELLVAMDSQQEAAADLEKVLALEPRHYHALAIVGQIAEAAGEKGAALAAYRRAITLNPMLDSIARRAGRLTEDAEKKPPPT